jgi:flagellar biosynthesis/type III secretory pathway protein FliH
MEKCRPLMEYATLVDKIRRYKVELGSIEAAVEKAVDECIMEGILADFLIGHKAEVMDVCLTEYDEAATQKAFKEEGYEEGYDDGYDSGYGSGYDSCENAMVRLQSYLIENNRLDDLRRTTYDKEYRNLLISKLPKD